MAEEKPFGLLVYGTIPGEPSEEKRTWIWEQFRDAIEKTFTETGTSVSQLFWRTEGTAWKIEKDVQVERIRRALSAHRHPHTDPCRGLPIAAGDYGKRCSVAESLWPGEVL